MVHIQSFHSSRTLCQSRIHPCLASPKPWENALMTASSPELCALPLAETDRSHKQAELPAQRPPVFGNVNLSIAELTRQNPAEQAW